MQLPHLDERVTQVGVHQLGLKRQHSLFCLRRSVRRKASDFLQSPTLVTVSGRKMSRVWWLNLLRASYLFSVGRLGGTRLHLLPSPSVSELCFTLSRVVFSSLYPDKERRTRLSWSVDSIKELKATATARLPLCIPTLPCASLCGRLLAPWLYHSC